LLKIISDMEKILGIDLGTNSIGWAIVERDGMSTKLLDNGVHIFQEGVNRVKGNEEPAVKTRTEARASRRHYFRRRLRKIELLNILVENAWCPYLSSDELKEWRVSKKFPLNADFINWLHTDDNKDCNPYHDRHRCLNETLNLSIREDRYSLGRAFYHLNQRRGFLSNRKDQGSDEENGKVKTAIGELDAAMASVGYEYLGDYFYHLYQEGGKIRKHYTSRNEHYLKEFRAICKKQKLDESVAQRLFDAIFFQRPLKSQKGLVGKCPFESGKARCAISHPAFEEFRMLSFINNIRLALPGEKDMRALTQDEKDSILPLFYRKSKSNFDFSDISKKLAGKNVLAVFSNYGADADINTFRINYRDSANVSGCPMSAQLVSIFGEEWQNGICEQYTLSKGKSQQQIIDDVWHVLLSFDNDDKLTDWAKNRLQLSDDEVKSFVEIKVPQGYASLSLCAIRKMIPWLREGYRYDEAAMLANIGKVVPIKVWTEESSRSDVLSAITGVVTHYTPNPDIKNDSKQRKIEEELCNLGIFDIDMSKLYHPSKIEVYPKSMPNQKGFVLLQSPRTDSVRNPMAMRALFRLRALVNELIKEGKIDCATKINIELARNLNDFNSRRAIELFQRENEKRRESYRKSIEEYYHDNGINGIPSEDDILKYELWEEQNHMCLYTGKQISISGFLGENPLFDIEHTVPRSRGGDNSKANKTLCECKFNRDVKKGHLPSELANAAEILSRIESLGWDEMMENLHKDINKSTRSAKAASDKATKDKAIQRRHYAKMQLDYLKDKSRRFKMTDVPDGFSNRQGVDIGIIGRYARMYMQTVFPKVYTVKGETTAEFRKMWGLQDNYSKKERINHCHHCIDAITIACIGRNEYDLWAQYKGDVESHFLYGTPRPTFKKPWDTFTEDVKGITDNLLVSHYTPDKMGKQSKKVLRKRGVIQRDAGGNLKYVQGDTARGSLHLQTNYGAIKSDDDIRYVVRKELASLSEKDIKNIVDDVVRAKIENIVKSEGISALQGNVWMNEEKGVPIKKVRLYVPSVTNPIALKRQRFESDKEYKRQVYVANESNYGIAIYEGKKEKGKTKRSFILRSNIEAARILSIPNNQLFPDVDTSGNKLQCVLKNGTMVLFYENDRQELLCASNEELSKRLYKVSGFSTMRIQQYEYGMMTFVHHQEARSSGEISSNSGVWRSSDSYRAKIALNHNQIKAMVEGYDLPNLI